MSLGAPWMLLLLLPVALVAWLMARAQRLQRAAACLLKGVASEEDAEEELSGTFCAKHPKGRSGKRFLTPFPPPRDCLVLGALACMVIALARPQWNPHPYDVERRGRDLVIVLDVSRSMLAADVFPSRLEAARIAIHEALPALAGQRIALVTFAGSAAVRVPLTLDHGFVRYMLDRADPSDADLGSTSLQAAFEKAAETVLNDSAAGRRDLVLFTDGEDHLSNIEKTAELLAKCGARILIIGIGNPVRGARVPAASGTGQWMRYKDAEVVSRLDEGTLEKLAGKGSHVTYYAARTQPFDFVSLYQKMIAGAGGDVVVGELREVHYTEGYPYLLGLSVALWLASTAWRLPPARYLVLLALLLPGCARRTDDGAEEAYRAKFKQGGELLQRAEEQSGVDLSGARGLLVDAREAYLRAGLLRPGDVEAARRVTAVTGRLRQFDAALAKQQAEEKKRGEQLAEVIRRLQKLTQRQTRLSQQSRLLLRSRPLPAKEELNRLAPAATAEQQAVQEGTARVLDTVTAQQSTLRKLLAQAFGEAGKRSETELDPVAGLLSGAVAAQKQALASLAPGAAQWPQANSALFTAAGRMQQALEELRSQQPPSNDDKNAMPPGSDNDYDDDMDGTNPEVKVKKPQAAAPGDFEAALSLRSLPVPKYTAEEILAEESANQQKRAKQKAARAGAKVEKNW